MILLRKENKPKRQKIGGLFCFPEGTSDEVIIEHILKDFSLKLLGIIRDYYDPAIGCQCLCTYEIFNKRWAIDDPGDVSSDGEEIYSEIPSDKCARYIRGFHGGEKYTDDVIRRAFGGGEFPIVKIWKGYHKGLNEIHATYSIMR